MATSRVEVPSDPVVQYGLFISIEGMRELTTLLHAVTL